MCLRFSVCVCVCVCVSPGGATILCHFWKRQVLRQSRGLRLYVLCLDISSCMGSRITHNYGETHTHLGTYCMDQGAKCVSVCVCVYMFACVFVRVCVCGCVCVCVQVCYVHMSVWKKNIYTSFYICIAVLTHYVLVILLHFI